MNNRRDNEEYIEIVPNDESTMVVPKWFKKLFIFILLTSSFSLFGALIFAGASYDLSHPSSHLLNPYNAGAGALVLLNTAILIYLMTRKSSKKKTDEVPPIYQTLVTTDPELNVVYNWSIIEGATVRLMLDMGYKMDQGHNLPLILIFLERRLEETHQKDLLQELLHVRNHIVHKGYKLSAEEEVRMQRASDEILLTLKKLSKKRRLK